MSSLNKRRAGITTRSHKLERGCSMKGLILYVWPPTVSILELENWRLFNRVLCISRGAAAQIFNNIHVWQLVGNIDHPFDTTWHFKKAEGWIDSSKQRQIKRTRSPVVGSDVNICCSFKTSNYNVLTQALGRCEGAFYASNKPIIHELKQKIWRKENIFLWDFVGEYFSFSKITHPPKKEIY